MQSDLSRSPEYAGSKDISAAILDLCDRNLLYQSRLHTIPSFSSQSRKVFVKREDESGFGISGYKKRKYASLIPHLLHTQPKEIIVIGTAFSNHVCGIVQLLNENHLPYSLWLKESHQLSPKGNWFLTQLLARPDKIHWISPNAWNTVDEEAQKYAEIVDHSVFILPEGGSVKEAVAGATTLSLDLIRSEEEEGERMDHIFMDLGTGFTAAVTAYMLGMLGRRPHLHFVKIGAPNDDYGSIFEKASGWIEELTGRTPTLPPISWHLPVTAKSFGQVNSNLSQFIQEFAREEGILTDPIYSAKLFMTAKMVMQLQSLKGNCMIIHSGGGVGLLGHSERMRRG